jgi:RecB family exonuclease
MTQYLSASKLKAYRMCPKRHHEEPFKESPAVNFGSAVHAGLAAYWRGGEFLPAYKKVAADKKVDPKEEARAIACYQTVRDHPRLEGLNVDHVLVVESEDGEVEFYGNKYFQVDIVQNQWGLRGGMDLVLILEDGSLLIVDWKTGKTEEEDDLQLSCYALAARLKYPGFPTIKVAFCYLEQGGKWAASEWNDQTLPGALEYIDKLAKAYIVEKDWAPTPNKYCSYCTLKGKCPAYSKQLQAPVVKDEWDIKPTRENFGLICTAIEKLDAIEKAASKVKDALEEGQKAILADGPIMFDGREFFLAPGRKTYDYDLAPIFEEAGQVIGRSPLEALSFSSTGYDDMVKKLAELPGFTPDTPDGDRKKALADARKALKTIKDNHKIGKPGKPKVSTRVGKDVPEDQEPAGEKNEEPDPANPPTGGRPTNTAASHVAGAGAGSSSSTAPTASTGSSAPAATKTSSGGSSPTAPSSTTLSGDPKPGDLVFTVCWGCGQVHADRPDAVADTCRGCGDANALQRAQDFKAAQKASDEIKISLSPALPPGPSAAARKGKK